MSSPQAKTQKMGLTWLINYVRESIKEIRKVTWPSQSEVIKYSTIVIGLCILLAVFFAGLDWILSLGVQKMIALKK